MIMIKDNITNKRTNGNHILLEKMQRGEHSITSVMFLLQMYELDPGMWENIR